MKEAGRMDTCCCLQEVVLESSNKNALSCLSHFNLSVPL